jgi:dTDP-4-dehydrorhamnose 3,5-epimerase
LAVEISAGSLACCANLRFIFRGSTKAPVSMIMNALVPQDVPRIFVPQRHRDARGWFSETFREDKLREHGITCRFVQENQSYSNVLGTVRGLHFQRPPSAQAKLIGVVHGRILDVIVDVQKNSPTYGQYALVELSAETGKQLYVPVGFAHGFVTLVEEVVVIYRVSDYYVPACDGGIRWDDPDIGVPWPINRSDAVVSDKDKSLPLLRDFVSPFAYTGNPLDPSALADATPL